MSNLTTIAALPTGAGQSANLRAEIGEARKPREIVNILHGDTVTLAWPHGGCTKFTAYVNFGGFPTISPDMLDTSE